MLSKQDNSLIAYRHGQPEYIPCFFTDMVMSQACPGLERPLSTEPGAKDAFGIGWTYEPSLNAAIPTPNEYLFEEISEWREKLKIPDLEKIDWKKQALEDRYSTIMGMPPGEDPEQFMAGKAKICMSIQGMFERLHACMGFENALFSIADDPDECYAFFGAIADYKIAFLKKVKQYYDFDIIEMHDDYGSQNSLFMSLDTWRKLLKPHLKRIVDACHELGFIYQHHSCGHIEPLIEEFIELGMDAVDTWQAASNPNLKELKQKYQDKLCFCGGFDNTFVLDRLDATPEEIQAEYRRVIDNLAPGGSFVIFPITATFNFIPAFLQEHFQYGMGFYASGR